MEGHNLAVAAIAAEVHRFYQRQQPFRIYHGSTNSTRQSQHSAANTVNTTQLNHVLAVNPDTKTILVEPNVPMDTLVQATLAHGLIPLVVMEFPGITAGGGFSGTSGESSSFRHGFFDATVNRIELVLANGDIRTVSQKEADEQELFWAAASSFGTLGVVTMLEIQCKEAKPYVELTYHSTSSMTQAMQIFRETTASPETEYLDGIIYAPDHIVVCAGRLVDAPATKTPIQRFTRAHDPWFYIHTQRKTRQIHQPTADPPVSVTDTVPIQDYLFRYDRGAFWTGRYAFRYFRTPFNRITRYILDTFMHTRVMYHALHKSGLSKQYIIQDVAVPYKATGEFLTWLDQKDTFGAYPIWLCPLHHSQGLMARGAEAGPHQSRKDDPDDDGDCLMNFGLWAPSPYAGDQGAFIAQNRRLEEKVREFGGKKWLYAHAYYTEEEFWSIYDRKRYDGLRAKYHAAYLPDLYQKVRVDVTPVGNGAEGWVSWAKRMAWETWPVCGLYGVYKAWRGGDYYLIKSKTD
ncbi:FAD binding domain protein [Aspergillus coremiiformis]|uniref:Delta(24)-sterol reductase n=1 Tax=Aspergillus coremiiformis TaxID=138285 RepID=A0A5N6ZDC4_9EURO|nr:FAD binding domain protein [Aspergillus coremiiformis]